MICTYALFTAHPRIGKIIEMNDLQEGEWGEIVGHFHHTTHGSLRARYNGRKYEKNTKGNEWRDYTWRGNWHPCIKIKIKGTKGIGDQL